MGIQSVRRCTAVALLISVVSVSVSCTSITEAGPERVSVDTGDVGAIVPGVRQWLSWTQANDHCASQGKEPELVDLKGSVVQYRCISKK